MSKVIGIDLGTTNSCVAVIENGQPIVIPNSEGSRTTPSVVAFTKKGERLVGQIAKRQSVTNPESTISAVKRLMGRRFDSEEAKKQRDRVTYHIVESPNGDAWVKVGDKTFSPPEISALVLQSMKQTAEAYLGQPVTEAVVTVPAYFNDAQRQATKDAGKIAGLDVKRILNEPTAAALAYGLDKGGSQKIAVYDLGGGTFDISILEIGNGVFSVRSTNGDTFLGGEDFDQRVVELLLAEFKTANGVDLHGDRMALQRIKDASEKAKHELSSSLETEANLPFLASDATGPKHLLYALKRAKLESLVQDLVDQTLGPCEQALKDAALRAREIDEVILVGGMTRMPLVQKRVQEFFGRAPSKGVNPDEVVAVGAAIQAAALKGEVKEVLLLDVTPLSLGVETGGGVFTRLIPRNTTIPTRQSEIFTTSVDNQNFVPIHVLQGEREMAADNKSLERFELTGIPLAPRGLPQIEVSFEIDANGIVHVSAKDLGTGRAQSIRVTASSGLSDTEIQKILQDAEQYRESDQDRREIAELRVRAEALLYTAGRAAEDYGDIVAPADREALGRDIQELQALLGGEMNAADVRSALERLESTAYRIAEAMYSSAEGTGQGSGQGSAQGSGQGSGQGPGQGPGSSSGTGGAGSAGG